MKLHKNIKKFIVVILAACITFSAFNMPSFAAEDESDTIFSDLTPDVLEAGKQFTFKGMPYNGKNSPIKEYNGEKLTPSTIQNFAYTPDGKYVFTTSEGRSGGKRHTLLSRCRMPGTIKSTAKANFIETTVLANFGHGETIDITQPDLNEETYDIWVATKPTGGFYGLQIARITYEVVNDVGIITNVVRLSNFKWTNVNKKGKATRFSDQNGVYMPNRVNVSIDVENNQIAFRVEFTNGEIRYLIYNYKKINKALNKTEDGLAFDMKNAAKWQLANLQINAYPYKTYQSFCILDNTLYICGGYLGRGAKIYVTKYKTQKMGKTKQKRITKKQFERIINIIPQLTVKKQDLGRDDLEIEGLKVYHDKYGYHDLYINFYQRDIPITSSIGVYKFCAEDTVETEQ